MTRVDTALPLQELLSDAGAAARILSPRDVQITPPSGARIDVRLVFLSRPPTAREMRQQVAAAAAGTTIGFVTPRINSISRRVALADPRVALFGTTDGVVILRGEELTPAADDRQPNSGHRRVSAALFALQRVLTRTPEPRFQSELARECGVSQVTVSNLLAADSGLAEKTTRGWIARDPRSLLDRFLTDYPGAGGLSQLWYSSRPVIEQAERAWKSGPRALLSGDSAADAIAPWRIPTSAVLYAETSLPLESSGFAETDSPEATLRVVVPADRTLWATATAWYPTGRTVDPLIAAWDLKRTGGSDVDEAVDHLLDKELAWFR
ncbi:MULTISPECIES: hypothetical protein [unclassified Rathayibacter]|uniref:hypothetical protein n=1 Tax=unclassified Rathayibacter TaxID=2609250 RepID=UPI000F4BE2BA|nr:MULTISPECIES: hypothetical protein [unclassified Rathayibacter]ROP48676.1 hypothetical protein EDF45_2793 [Rathayibacter sp. PhB186]ROS49825.1 hypothetical protein EDF44_2795 [Rathayibacter sp. PhB185]